MLWSINLTSRYESVKTCTSYGQPFTMLQNREDKHESWRSNSTSLNYAIGRYKNGVM